MSDNRAFEAFAVHINAINEQLVELKELANSNFNKRPEDITWADVTTAQGIAVDLRTALYRYKNY
jgi:hypothetical protein